MDWGTIFRATAFHILYTINSTTSENFPLIQGTSPYGLKPQIV